MEYSKALWKVRMMEDGRRGQHNEVKVAFQKKNAFLPDSLWENFFGCLLGFKDLRIQGL